jgi:transposase-like protein
MLYVRFLLSLRQVEDLLHERSIDICHETVGAWWNLFGPMFAAEMWRFCATICAYRQKVKLLENSRLFRAVNNAVGPNRR